MIQKLIKNSEQNPKILFIIDGLGAAITAFCLGIVLVKFEWFFGIPSKVLYALAIIPIFYVLYDFYSYRKPISQVGTYLKGIAILNLLYCILSFGLGLMHSESMTIWAWIYIINEIIIIVSLSMIELRTANKLRHKFS